MSDMVFLLAQAGLTGCLAGWLIAGVIDNWVHPKLNEEAVAMVMRFDRMREDFPEDFAHVAYRRIEDPGLIRLAFRSIVVWETIAALTLVAGTLCLAIAAFGGMSAEAARGVALLGALAFTLNWAGFLIGGNYFCYWYCHYAGQATHFLLALWGTLGMIFLAMPG